MEKLIKGMGKIEFGRFYNRKNRIISSFDESPILDSKKVQSISLNQLKKLLDKSMHIWILVFNDIKI